MIDSPFFAALEELLQNASPGSLRKAQVFLSEQYRGGKTSESVYQEAPLAYLATRCPAIFAAVCSVLQKIPFPIRSLLDLGAGPGTATWAAFETFPGLQTAHLFERDVTAIELGKQIADKSSFQPTWHHQLLERVASYPSADLVLLSYSLGELRDPIALLERLVHIPTLVLLEPGTPRGYQTILRAREYFISNGFFLLAPCPHAHACPLKSPDWCHFSVRLARSSLHRMLKQGELGYEDEKFSYLIASRMPASSVSSRILRHPQKHSGHVRLVLCTPEGKRVEEVVTRKEKERYRGAKEAKWGEEWEANLQKSQGENRSDLSNE